MVEFSEDFRAANEDPKERDAEPAGKGEIEKPPKPGSHKVMEGMLFIAQFTLIIIFAFVTEYGAGVHPKFAKAGDGFDKDAADLARWYPCF